MGIFEKMKGKIAKAMLVLSAIVCCALSFGSVAKADHYYDGGDLNFSTYGAESSNGVPSKGAETKTKEYIVDVIVKRGTSPTINSNYVANYGSSKTGWKYIDARGELVDYDANNSICNSLPLAWTTSGAKLHLGSNGVVYYTCSTDGYPSAYIVDFTQYGYYDKDGKVQYTGYSGYLYCPKCSDISKTGERYTTAGKATPGESVGSYTYTEPANSHWQGVYTYPELKNSLGNYMITTDPGYLGEDGEITYAQYLEKIARYSYANNTDGSTQGTFQKCTSNIDGSGNGYYVRYVPGAKAKASSGSQAFVELPKRSPYQGYNYAIKIANPNSNKAVPTFGYHNYKKYYEKINFSYWFLSSHGMCIHLQFQDDVFSPLYYNNGTKIGIGGYNKTNNWGRCGKDYEKGYTGICADCGEEITALTYASPQTIASLKSVENGVEYYYFCPRQIGNMSIGGRTFYYLNSQVENQWTFMHACYATSVNQYYINFNTNKPEDGIMFGNSYTIGGYFYKLYNDDTNVDYVQEGATLGYRSNPTPVKSTNTISNPSWTCHGYEFDCWEMQLSDGKTWVKVDTNTWEWVAKRYGESNPAFNEDGHTFNLRARWKKIKREVKIVDGTSTSSTVLKTYTVPYLKKQEIKFIPLDKTARVTYDYQGGTGGPDGEDAPVKFSSYTSYSGNKGVFDSVTKTYYNNNSTTTDYNNENSTPPDYIFTNYRVGSVVLPTPTKERNVFLGWYTKASGGTRVGGAGERYAPPASGTKLYAHWSADSMTISAKAEDPVGGSSYVSWVYSNVAVNGTAYYKIYRSYANDNTKWTDANNTGVDVTNQEINVSYTTKDTYKIPYDGIYEITLYGAKGSDVTVGNTTVNGGKGGVETLRVLLKKNDVLKVYPANGAKSTYSAAFNGGKGYVGSKIRAAHTANGGTKYDDGVYVGYGNNKAGYGGAATVVTLKRGNDEGIIAIAGGGGGAHYQDWANKYSQAGGNGGVNESSTISTDATAGGAKTSDSQTSTSTLIYSIMNAGGGAGATGGDASTFERYRHAHIATCYHKHTAGGGSLVDGTALADNAKYSSAGGCYTTNSSTTTTCGTYTSEEKIHYCGGAYWDYIDGCYKIGYCPNCGVDESGGCTSPDGECVKYSRWHCTGCNAIGNKDETHSIGVTAYSRSCGKSSTTPICGNDENWKDEINTASTGGSNYYAPGNDVFYHSNEGNHNDTVGKVTIEGIVVGISTSTSYIDQYTDDVNAPNQPTELTGACVTKLLNSNSAYSTYQIYINGIGWKDGGDNGTKYSFKGETWDKDCTTAPRVSTTHNAEVTITSGIKGYYYKVSTNATEAQSGTGWNYTSNLYGVEIDTEKTYNTNAPYSTTFYLHVYAVDYTGNKSGNAVFSIPFSYIPSDIIDEDNHTPTSGNVSATVDLSKSDNAYQVGNTYYVKADGASKLCVVTEANVKNSNNYTRITTLSLGNSASKGFNVTTPLLSHDTAHTIASGSIENMSLSGKVSIDALSNTTTKTTEYFAMTNENSTSVTSYVTTSCLGQKYKGCTTHNNEEISGSGFTVVGDKTAPTFTVGSSSFKGENFSNIYEYDWKVSNIVNFYAVDNGSGIKSIKITDNFSHILLDKVYTTGRATNSGTLSFPASSERECTYTATVEDNVGNKTIVKITTKTDSGKPFITDVTGGITVDDVYNQAAPIGNTTGSWPTTNVNTTWEYNWVPADFTVSYTASDDVSGIKTFNLYNADASWNKGDRVASGTHKEGVTYALEYKVTTEGTTRYILEAVDNTGNTTLVYIIVRIDKTSPAVSSASNDVKDNILDGMTIAEANDVVNGVASLNNTSYTWTINWVDTKSAATTTDTSGMASSTLYIYDKANPENAKSYPMLDASGKAKSYNSYTHQKSSSKFLSKLKDTNGNNTLRYSSVTFEQTVNTFTEFPTSAELGWRIVGVDNAGNTYSHEGGTISNFAVKAVFYTTKDNGYNILSEDGKTSVPYFKTGEVGFVEVWTIGYVDKLELDFSDKQVGKVAMDCIKNGSLLPKYNLGYPLDPTYQRFVTNMMGHKVGTNPDKNGVPYATHYVYIASDVNNSLGSDNTDGWMSDGTMIRIPPNFQLAKKGQKDKNGNELYKWETCQLAVNAYKGEKSNSSKPYYVIWDESGDDLHYRITHETFGF